MPLEKELSCTIPVTVIPIPSSRRYQNSRLSSRIYPTNLILFRKPIRGTTFLRSRIFHNSLPFQRAKPPKVVGDKVRYRTFTGTVPYSTVPYGIAARARPGWQTINTVQVLYDYSRVVNRFTTTSAKSCKNST